MNAYWSLRTKIDCSGNGSGDSATPMSFAACCTSGCRLECDSPTGTTSSVGVNSIGMSMLTLATSEPRGTVGRRAYHCAPSRPFSSAVSAMNSNERFGWTGIDASWRAASSITATPSALSSAPL